MRASARSRAYARVARGTAARPSARRARSQDGKRPVPSGCGGQGSEIIGARSTKEPSEPRLQARPSPSGSPRESIFQWRAGDASFCRTRGRGMGPRPGSGRSLFKTQGRSCRSPWLRLRRRGGGHETGRGPGSGSILLVDPETLSYANVGRHPLGAGSVGSYKATAMAKRLSDDFPHMVEVTSSTERCENLLVLPPDTLASKDLIVSAMGSWSAEGTLNEWHLSRGRARPIVYGWTEAHACAGHAVLVMNKGGCLGCGMGPFGNPLLRVTDWPEGGLRRRSPHAGRSSNPMVRSSSRTSWRSSRSFR